MTRIEEALRKIRLDRRAAPSAVGGAVPLGRVISTPSGEAAVAPTVPKYGGKRLEIAFDRLQANGLLAPGGQESTIENEYRQIKRLLLANASQTGATVLPRANLIMIASALSGDGKTFTCVNLSLSFAREKDWHVTLVDADCTRPRLTRLFGVEGESGLLDALRDPAVSFDSLVMPTNVPNLSLLPVGSRDQNASELLASDRMNQLCQDLAHKDSRRVIVFDSAPLLLTPHAPSLAANVGQVVLVVCANKTPRDAVIAARDKLDPSKAIGLVLNQAPAGEGVRAYGTYPTLNE